MEGFWQIAFKLVIFYILKSQYSDFDLLKKMFFLIFGEV